MFAFGSTLPMIILFTITSLTIILYLRYKHIEKLELIKKGDNLIYQDALQQMKYDNLMRGIIFISLACGVFVSHLINTLTTLEPIVIYISIILFFAGIGSLAFYFIIRKR